MKKIIGIILLLIGILSFIGGLVSPSDAYPGVVIMGYILKFAFIFGGIILIVKGQKSSNVNKSNKSNQNTLPQSTDHRNTENKKLNEHPSTLEEKKKPDEHSLILEKKEILSDLKRDNVITMNEYNEKLALLNEQEQNIVKQEKKKQIDAIVETQISPFISKLNELLKANILSKDEFEIKKKQLYKKHHEKIVKKMPHLNPNKSHQIETISKYSLKPAQQRRISDIERKLQKGDVIITDKESKNKYYICHQNEINTLLNDLWSWNKYIYVDPHIEEKET